MRICCISDLHGYLPEIPECDAVLIAGDIVPTHCHDIPNARGWLDTNFRRWLEGLADRDIKVIGIAGNHDFVFERRAGQFATPIPWVYLEDSGSVLEQEGAMVYGLPYQIEFHNWAFNRTEPELESIWSTIPDWVEVLIVHGPPYGVGDRTPTGQSVGSPSLLRWIETKKPRLVVTGHIHSAYGVYKVGETLVVNCAYVGEDYRPHNKPVVLDYGEQSLDVIECGLL